MQKPRTTNLPADLPENWQIGQAVTPTGTDAGLTKQHGYNYQSQQINDAHEAINELNEAFEDVQENLENLQADSSIVDADTVPLIKSDNTKKRISFLNIVNAIKTKFSTVYAALVHTHGNITNDGKIGSVANQVVVTSTDGKMIAGTAPVAGGGTGATTAAGARTNLGITLANLGAAPTTHNHNASDINAGTLSTDRLPTLPVSKGGTGATDAAGARANLGAAPTTHNHDASQINAGTLSADRLPIVPVSKGGTGVTNLNVDKLKKDTNSDTFINIYLSPSGNDSATGLTTSVPMKTIRAAIGRYGGLNRVRLNLAPGTYADSATVVISGNTYVDITGTSTTPGAVVITHPIIFESNNAKLIHVTFDLTNSSETYPGITLRQSAYDIQNCVFKGKAAVHAGINVSLGSSGYVVNCTFQSGVRAAEIGSGAMMTALTSTVAAGFEIGFNVNGGVLVSSGNTNNATTKFTMYNSAVIFSDGVLLNPVSGTTVATAEVI